MNKIGMRIPPQIGANGIEGVAKFASEIGLNVVDLPYLNQEIKSTLEKEGLEIGTVDGIGAVGQTKLLSPHQESRNEAINALKKQISEVSVLGGKVIFICLVPESSMTRKEAFEIWKIAFPSIVEHAEQNNVFLALEGWPGPAPFYPTLGCTPEMLRAMFNVIPSKHFGLNYDPSHLVRLGIDYLRVLNEFGHRVTYCHGKDTEILHDDLYEFGNIPATFGANYDFSEGSWRYTIPGQGEVDWGKVALRLEKINYNGPISIELEDHRYWGTLEKEQLGIVKAKEHLELYFKQ